MPLLVALMFLSTIFGGYYLILRVLMPPWGRFLNWLWTSYLEDLFPKSDVDFWRYTKGAYPYATKWRYTELFWSTAFWLVIIFGTGSLLWCLGLLILYVGG